MSEIKRNKVVKMIFKVLFLICLFYFVDLHITKVESSEAIDSNDKKVNKILVRILFYQLIIFGLNLN